MIPEINHKKGGNITRICQSCGKRKNIKCFNVDKRVCKNCTNVYKEGFYKPPRTGEEIFIGKFL